MKFASIFALIATQAAAKTTLSVSVDEAEAAAAVGTIYEVTHAGWAGITTYVDQHGNTRTKTEVFVAGSSITSDADDDSVLADS